MLAPLPLSDLRLHYPNVFELDANLDRLVHRIELLRYVNPLNIEKEKHRFFASKYTHDPEFHYPKLKFDPYKLHRLFYAQRLERITDDVLRQLYQEVIYFYSNMIQCIETIGKRQLFYYNSLRVYGTPTEKDLENAKYILHFEDETMGDDMHPRYTAMDAKAYFEKFVSHYRFPLNVRFSTHIAADAMVSNTDKSLILKKNATFSENQLRTLAHHEIGVHLVTTYNGLEHPLKILSNGLPKNVETQEGLAVFSEYMGGALTLKRLKELAYRVLAADSLIKGYSFADTFDLIHGQYKLNRDAAFSICLRAHRGGGFTKDRLYLSGLQKIYKRYRQNKSMDILLLGKVNMQSERQLTYLMEKELVRPLAHKNQSFKNNANTNAKLNFILNNLK